MDAISYISDSADNAVAVIDDRACTDDILRLPPGSCSGGAAGAGPGALTGGAVDAAQHTAYMIDDGVNGGVRTPSI